MASGICLPGTPFHDLCKKKSRNNTVTLTFCNHGFCDMLLNWLETIHRCGIDNEVVVALDKKSYDYLTARGIECYCHDLKEKVYGEKSANFGTVEFITICNEKPFLVNEILKGGFDVLWTDTDIVFYKNPYPHFEEILSKTNVDLILQSDDDDICAGYFFACSNSKTIPFFEKVIAYLNPMIDDQMGLRRYLALPECAKKVSLLDAEGRPLEDFVLKGDKMNGKFPPIESSDSVVRFFILDRVQFPNGTAYYNAKLPQRLGVTPYIVHNNCIIGHDSKKDRFKLYNQWYIDVEDEEEKPYQTLISPKLNSLPPVVAPLAVMKAHLEIVTAVTEFNGKIYSAAHDKTLRTWELAEGKPKLLESHYLNKRGGIWTMQFAEIPTSSQPKPPSDAGAQVLALLNLAQAATSSSTPVATETRLFTGGHDKILFNWKLNCQAYKGHFGVVNSLIVHPRPDGPILFSASDDFDTGEKIRIYRSHTSFVSAVTASGPILYSASHDGTARAWEISSGRILQIYMGHTGWVRCLAIYKPPKTCDSATPLPSYLTNEILITGSSDNTIRLWAVQEGYCIGILKGHEGGVNALAVDSAAHVLYSASDDCTIRSWDLKTGTCTAVLRGHNGVVSCLTLLKDGLHLVSGSYDRTLCLWSRK